MPDIEVTIGGKAFVVSCQPGEEHFLRSAASHLDAEAQPIIASMGRLPEVKMLLMAGLMLADRTAALDDEMRELRESLAALKDRPEPEPKRIEVPVIPSQVPQTFAELAARVDALADRISEKALAAATSAGAQNAIEAPGDEAAEHQDAPDDTAEPDELPAEEPDELPDGLGFSEDEGEEQEPR